MEDSCLPLGPKPMPSVPQIFLPFSCWWLRLKRFGRGCGSQSPEKGRESPIYLNGFPRQRNLDFSIGFGGFPASQVWPPSAGITFGVPFSWLLSSEKKQFQLGSKYVYIYVCACVWQYVHIHIPPPRPTFQANLVVFTVFFLTFGTLKLRAFFVIKNCNCLQFCSHPTLP